MPKMEKYTKNFDWLNMTRERKKKGDNKPEKVVESSNDRADWSGEWGKKLMDLYERKRGRIHYQEVLGEDEMAGCPYNLEKVKSKVGGKNWKGWCASRTNAWKEGSSSTMSYDAEDSDGMYYNSF